MTAPVQIAVPSPTTNVRRVVSPGGIEGWLVHDETVPLLALRFAFRGGSAQDPVDKPGVASFLSALLDEGAGPYDAQAFHERLDEFAVELSFDADRDGFGGALRTLSRNLDEACELTRLALTEPRLDEASIERVRSQILAGLRRELTDPNAMAARDFSAAAFPGHAYGRPAHGSLASLPTIGRADFDAYLARVVAKDGLKVAAVGAIDEDAFGVLLDRVFGGLPTRGALRAVATVEPAGLGERRVVDFDVPQSVVRFGTRGLSRSDPDYMAGIVVNHVLGGGVFQSRLFREVRERRGLAYSVHSSLVAYEHAAMMVGGTSTKNERVAESLQVIGDEIRALATDGPTPDELDKARRFLIGSYGLRFDSSSKIAGQLLQIQVEDLGIDYMSRRNGLVAAVALDDAQRAASRILGRGEMLVTVVGRPQGL